jgi:hypothetical protein
MRPIALAAALAAVLLGAGLRLVWCGDMEYKYDQAWTFEHSQSFGQTPETTGAGAWRGMLSSVGIDNPGLSLWVYVGLARVFDAHDPPALNRAVQVVDVGAIVLLLVFVWRAVPAAEREPWLWAVALLSLNPFMVLLHRALWPPSVLPIISLPFLVGWWYRDRPWGAFLWGVAGALAGQIQMGGFFFAAGFAAWAALFDRRGVSWLAWLAGSFVGALPLVPWFYYSVLLRPPVHAVGSIDFTNVINLRFWLVWITEPFGLGLGWALGRDFQDFLTFPHIDGRPTYLVWGLHVLLFAAWAALLVRGAFRLWHHRRHLKDDWIGRSSATAFTLSAGMWGFGLLFTVSLLPINRQYLLFAFPLEFLWVARLVLADTEEQPRRRRIGRAVLGTLCVVEALLSVAFLDYIHVHEGSPNGSYGIAYHALQRQRAPRADGWPVFDRRGMREADEVPHAP